MKQTIPIHLQPSEAALLQAASRIYAALLTLDPQGDERKRLERSILTAIEMAKSIDAQVKSDGEMS